MEYNKIIQVVNENLKSIGIQINEKNYDGIIIKKLEPSNTLDEGRNSKQTHIAITGKQMDIFPYLKSDGYNNGDSSLKKYFILQIPVIIKKENINYLDSLTNKSSEDILTYTSVLRSRRVNQADQIQVSLINMDDEKFIYFRRLIHSGDYLIILKKEEKFEYEFYGVKSENVTTDLIKYNNYFEKKNTKTLIKIDDYIIDSNFEKSELDIIAKYMNHQVKYYKKEKDLEEFILELEESRKQFLSHFSLEILADKKIEKNELKKILFEKKENNSLLYNLTENYSIFGSAKESNTTSIDWDSEVFISHLVDIDNYLSNNNVLSSKENYEDLYGYINNLNENYLKRIWFKKYLHILYPTIFPSQHSDQDKIKVLRLLSLDIEDSEIDRAWKLLQLEKISSIPGDYYLRIICFISSENNIYSADDNFTEIKQKFRKWLEAKYTKRTCQNYMHYLVSMGKKIDFNKKYDNNIFNIVDKHEYEKIKQNIIKHEEFKELNKNSNRGLKSALDGYGVFLSEMNEEYVQDEIVETNYKTKLNIKIDRNRVLFGAPGTGKSYTLNNEKDDLLKDGGGFERVTFHPDYSYAHFVGTYKPVSNESGEISYEYVPGPFMRTYVAAMKSANSDNPKPYLLIIEEINRANVAGVFGDVFQLLDRDSENISEYPIQTSEDMRKYLIKELGGDSALYTEIKIPDNMFIWATMNSADQGVYPMDTAFKRRWNFTYLGINDNEEGILEKEVSLGSGEYERKVKWNELRKAINIELLEKCKVNEDKLLGPYFITKNYLENNEEFVKVFKNKIIMYLFDDAAKHQRSIIFSDCKTKNIYSEICKEFDKKGVFIFSESIQEKFPEQDKVINEQEKFPDQDKVINEQEKFPEQDKAINEQKKFPNKDKVINELENSSYNTNNSFGNKKVAETKHNEED